MVAAKVLGTALQKALGNVFRCGSRSLLRGLLRRSLPTLDGAVRLPGLEGPVEVLRDRFGVPQVFAESERDLFFAQGYVHAQDRFFQMELGRRAGHGRLSELIGGSALEFDRLSRTIGFGRIAATCEKNGPPEPLEILRSYSAGVNARLSTEPLSPELRLLRLLEPEPWTPSDTAAWSMVVAWSLSASWELKLLREVAEGIGDWENLRGHLDPERGSNAWAVSPGRSASGSALLAGDPHLVLSIPCLWYEVGLYGGPYRVVGASLPGTPGVVIGHNKEIAWSVTAALTDVQDLYIERFKEGDSSLYEHAGGWREAGIRIEEIPVRGRREPVIQRVRTTVHGPVITDVLGNVEGELALRWATPNPLRLVEAGLGVNRARNKGEFLAALHSWTVPNQNFVYADRTGVTGKALAGPVPIRNNHRGDRPVPGWDGEHEWEGFLPFEKLPKGFDTEGDYVASANEAPEGDTIPGAYLPGYRKDRIGALLQATDEHTLETFREIQGDLYCAPAHALARRLAKLNPPPETPGNLLRDIAEWDGKLTAESRPGAVARAALEVLLRRATGAPTRTESTLPTGVEFHLTRLVPKLLDEPAGLPDEALREAFEEAVEILGESCSSDPEDWSWGALHVADLRHPLGRVGALRGSLNRGPYPAGGDSNTVRLAAFGSGSSDTSGRPLFGPVTTGPNYRFVVDTGDWEKAWSMVSPGQSGHPGSVNYDDQIGFWRNVRYRPMIFGLQAAKLAAKHRLVLEPGAVS